LRVTAIIESLPLRQSLKRKNELSLYTRVSHNRKRQYKPVNKKKIYIARHRLRPALCP